MFFNKYKNVSYNNINLSDIGHIQEVNIPLLPSRNISSLNIASMDGVKLNGSKKNAYKIEILLLIDEDNEFEYENKLKELRTAFDSDVPQLFFLDKDKFTYAIVEDEIEIEKQAMFSCECNIQLFCNNPYFFSKDLRNFNSDNQKIIVKNAGNKAVAPFLSLSFTKDTCFTQIELLSTKEKILIGKYPVMGIPPKQNSTELIYDECKTTTSWTSSSASIDSDRTTGGTIAVANEGEGLCLSTIPSSTTTWRGACYRTNLPTATEEFKIEAYFNHKSTGTNGDPTIGTTDKETITSGGKQTYYRVTCSSLNIRSGPGTKYKKIGALSKNDKIENGKNENGWVQFKYNNQTAYCSASYLTLVTQDSTTTITKCNMVTLSNTALRSSPSFSSSSKKTVAAGKVVRVITSEEYKDYDSNGVYRIYVKLAEPYEGESGYICKSNLEYAGNVIFEYDNDTTLNTADDKTGIIEVYLFSVNGVKIGKMSLIDDNRYYEYTHPKIYAGNRVILEDNTKVPPPKSGYKVQKNDGYSTIKVTNYLSGTLGDWNDFFGKMTIKREKVKDNYEWSCEVIKIKDGSVIKKQSTTNIKSNDFPTEELGYIVLYMGTQSDKLEKCSDMSIKWLKVDSINPITEEEANIMYFKNGDVLEVDCENHCTYLNHESCDYLVDIGSRFFKCNVGEEEIKISSDDDGIIGNAVIREKWLGGR